MRIGIDAHIILPQHKRYNPKIARYTEQLITHLIKADKKSEHTWVLFFDQRMEGSKKITKYHKGNVEIKHFPFVQYRKYLPVVYSHLLVSSFLRAARLDIFHSPEGLIPFLYSGKIVTTFHYVPRGESESNLFVRTFMLGARAAFARLLKHAKRIIVNNSADKSLLLQKHGATSRQVIVMAINSHGPLNWPQRVKDLLVLYSKVAKENNKHPQNKLAKKKKIKAKATKVSGKNNS